MKKIIVILGTIFAIGLAIYFGISLNQNKNYQVSLTEASLNKNLESFYSNKQRQPQPHF